MNIIESIIEAGEKVAEINPLLKIRYENQKNELLAAVECLIIESIHSGWLGQEASIRDYKLSLRDVQRYCTNVGRLNYLDSAYLQREVGLDNGFFADEEILLTLRKKWECEYIPWSQILSSVKLTEKDIEKLQWLKNYLVALGKIGSHTDSEFQKRIDAFNLSSLGDSNQEPAIEPET